VTSLWPHLSALQVLIPLLGAVVVAMTRSERVAFALTAAVSGALPVVSGLLFYQVWTQGPVSYALGGWPAPWGISYHVDLLNAFVLMLVSTIAAGTIPFAYRSIAAELVSDRRNWFYSLYLLCLTGLLGVTATGDAFNAFVFLEISSLSMYALIALGRDRRALLAAFQYLIMGTIGATFYVIGAGFLYLLTGTLNLIDIAARLAAVDASQFPAVVAALAFITVGVGLKLALVPLHFWLPNAYAYAPSWVTVFLSATATKVAFYLLLRFFFSVFGAAIPFDGLPIAEIFLGLSVIAMFVPSVIAVLETNVKRMMAFSSLAQIGYITLGIGLANQAGLTGSLVHLVNHAVMKACLFLALGAIVFRGGATELPNIAGIGRKMPLTMAAFTIAGLGLIGTPGTAGFISKWYLSIGAMNEGWTPLVFLIVASSLVSAVYVGRVLEVVWLRPPTAAIEKATDPPLSMLLPLLLFAAATVYFGLDTRWTVGIAASVAEYLIGGLK